MDKVRFGRALGGGAREAAKALLRAADAATAPNVSDPHAAGKKAGGVMGQRVEQVKSSTTGIKRGGRRFGEAVWRPFVKQSGVLWLEFTGVFFGLFALTAGVGIWKNRADLLGGGAAQERVWFAVGMMLVFGYFTISSFVRARRRGRR